MSVETEEDQQQSKAPVRNRQKLEELPEVDFMTSYNEDTVNDTSYATSQSSMIREGGAPEDDEDGFGRPHQKNLKSIN